MIEFIKKRLHSDTRRDLLRQLDEAASTDCLIQVHDGSEESEKGMREIRRVKLMSWIIFLRYPSSALCR
jgi:hypothetical protein